MKNKKLIVILAGVLAFALSFFLYLKSEKYTVFRLMFFHELSDKIVLEERKILVNENTHTRAERVLEEALLGPISIENRNIFPSETVVSSFIIRGEIAYLDLSGDLVFNNKEVEHNLKEQVDLLERNILFNTTGIQKVIITINGQIPDYTLIKE